MTEREKQIEEMEAIIISSHCDNPLYKDCYGECEYCIARDLYNAGYRKQSEGEWMATCVCNIFQCTNCKKTTVFYEFCNGVFSPKAYCPRCGARMKGGE